MPQVSYQYKNDDGTPKYTEIRYLDKLITRGAKYNKTSKNFTPIDIKKGEGSTTFGDLLLNMVKESISIRSFDSCVSNLP